MSFWCFLQKIENIGKSRPNFSLLRWCGGVLGGSLLHCLFSKVGACPTLWLACEFWQLTFTLQSEEKMDDVLKSGHFSILTISICSTTTQCLYKMCVLLLSLLQHYYTTKLETIPPQLNTVSFAHKMSQKNSIFGKIKHMCASSPLFSSGRGSFPDPFNQIGQF